MDRQRQVVPKRRGTRVKSCCTSIGLDPRDWQTIIVVWSQWTGRSRCGKHGVKINRLFFTQGFLGQQIDLKLYSKPYRPPMKGTKRWKAASKWRRLCHQAGQLILYTLKPCEVNVSNTIQKWITIIKTNTPHIPHVVNVWATDCWYMWVEGEILYQILPQDSEQI